MHIFVLAENQSPYRVNAYAELGENMLSIWHASIIFFSLERRTKARTRTFILVDDLEYDSVVVVSWKLARKPSIHSTKVRAGGIKRRNHLLCTADELWVALMVCGSDREARYCRAFNRNILGVTPLMSSLRRSHCGTMVLMTCVYLKRLNIH